MNIVQRFIKVDKKMLITKIEENLITHKAAFAEATRLWEKDVLACIDALNVSPYDSKVFAKLAEIHRKRPTSFENSYEEALLQLQMDVRNELDLSIHEFNSLACDKWDWSFEFSSNAYSSSATQMLKARK